MQRHLAGFKNVTCIQAAAWKTDGMVYLDDPGLGSWGMRVSDNPHEGAGVPAVSLKSLIHKFPGTKVDLLKIDIEGSEKEIFETSDGWLDSVSSIVIELHDRYKPGCSRNFFQAIEAFDEERWIGENVFVWRSSLKSS